MASQGALMYVGRAGRPDHLIQQTSYCSSSVSKDSNAVSEREYALDAEYKQRLHTVMIQPGPQSSGAMQPGLMLSLF